MASTFLVYLHLGFDHIVAVGAWDHILFIVALSAGYAVGHWRQLLVLVTAFTIGHSLTLALATLRLVSVNSTLVEILIPATILATGVFNLAETRTRPDDLDFPARAQRVKYAMALFFGLIHGLGFSTFLRAVLGREESIALPLFSFNVGLEVGQIVILACIVVVTWATVRWTPMRRTLWTIILSVIASVFALVLLAGRIPF
ncbi:MAG: HupE/UreJ family protein [Gemmatimonadota bacterium]|jgi:hypothetical protein